MEQWQPCQGNYSQKSVMDYRTRASTPFADKAAVIKPLDKDKFLA